MFIVAVQFTIAPESTQIFKDAVNENAAASEKTEPGCHQFDVCFNTDGTQCFLYEVYDDEAAFIAHKNTDHFKKFFATVEHLILNRRFESYEREPKA